MAGLTLSNKDWFDFNMNMADEVERLESPELNWIDVSSKSSVSWAGTPAQTDFAKRNQIVNNAQNAIRELVATSDAAPNDAYGQTQMAYVIAATNPGMDIKDALKIAQGGLLQKELNLQYEKKGGIGASWDTFRNGYWNAKAGEAFARYVADPTNVDALKLAEKYYDKALSFKTSQSGYNWFTDNVLLPYARISGISAPGSIGSTVIMIGGRVLSAATGYGWIFDIAKAGAALYSGTKAGMSQAGMDFYAMYREADANGQKLDMTDPTVRTLFLTDAALMGLIEVGNFFWSPTYRMMTNILTPTRLGNAFAKSFWQGVRYTGGKFILSDISESLEEFFQGLIADAIKNAVYNWSNEKNGTIFPIKGWEDIVLDASSAFAQTAVEMLPTVALNTAFSIGLGVFHASRASKNQKFTFDPNKKQGVINSKYIVGSQDVKAEVKAEEEQAKESGTPQQKASSDEKVDSIKVVQTEAGGAIATAEDRENLKELYRRNGGKEFDVLVEGVGIENLSSDNRSSSLNTFSLYINAILKRDGVVGYSEETGTLVVEDEKTKDEVKENLSKLSDLTEADNDYLVSPFSKGTARRVRVITQEQATKEGLATKAPSDWSFLNMNRQNAFRMSEQEYLDQEDAIDSFANIVSKITGQKAEDVRRLLDEDPDAISMALPEGTTWENLVASANFMPILSRITGRTTEDLLNSGDIIFDVTGRTQYVDRNTNQNLKYDEQTKKVYRIDKNTGERIEYDPGDTKNVARAGAEMGTTKDGNRKKYTIMVHKDALADDIVHELMHVARAMASKERLAGFIAAYGAQDLWTDDIKENEDGTYTFNGKVYSDRSEVFNLARKYEEQFVRDFMNYLATGVAPNAEVKTFFDRLKRFLREVVQRFRDSLSEKTVEAFDKLLNGELDVQPGQTIEEAAEASEATLTDEMSEQMEHPRWEANDYSDDEEMYDEEGNPLYSLQRATSAGTSVPNQIPKGYGSDMDYLRNWAKKSFGADIFLPGQTNFEQGMGISDTATRFLSRRKGIENLGTDPFNRTREYNERVADIALNRKLDTSSAMNVLNVIDSDEAMELVIAQSALPLKENGVAVFQIFHGDQSGQGQYKKDDAQYQRNMRGSQYVPHVEKFYNKVESRGDYIIAQNPKMDAVNEVTGGKFDFSAAEYGAVGKPFKNVNGSTISRSKYGVGKQVGNQIYVHKEYASDVVPADLMAKAEALLPEGFEYNTLMYDTKKPGVLRFDQAPDFDTAREPIPGDMVTVNTETGEVKRSHSDQIWHHKWEWVKNDYMGFNVKESYDWSKKWTAKISDIKGIGSRRVWEEKLEKAGLKADREVLYSLAENKQWQTMDANTQRRIEADYERTREKYYGTDKWMKAPNGQPTNLTERQWIRVRTPAFKEWFGDWENDSENASKIVDENGEPKVMYHGSSAMRPFDVFTYKNFGQNDYGWLGIGHYFTGNLSYAYNYITGNQPLFEVFLNVRDPYYASDEEHENLANYGDINKSREFTEEVENEGHDGVYYNGDLNEETVVFRSNQIKSATDNVGTFSADNDSILFSLNTEQQAERLYSIKQDTFSEVEEYINTLPEAERDRINKNFEAYKGSPWYYQTLSAALTRRDMDALMRGEDIPSNSFLYKAAKSKDGSYAVIEALKKGPEGVFDYVSSHSLIANSEKALFAVNGSLLDCNPTPECAQFCYVTNGQMAYPTAIIKAEMVALAIRLDPIKAARMAAYQYKFQAGYDTKLVMRMFDRGDFSAEYVPFIKELNRQGVGVQIFTKRPDFLYEIDRKRNVVMMSVDHSNVDMIDKYPDLPIAVVFQGKDDVAMIESLEERFKKHKGVILPVKIGREYVSNEDIMALPQWARVEFTCNIDRGLKTIENWNCRKCDLNGINGCFFGRGVKNRELVGRSIEDISIGEIYDIIGSLKDRSNATEELIARGIDLRNPLFGRVLDELLALRNRELERADGRTADQAGAEPSADTGRESETAPERRLVEEHNHAIEEFAKESNLPVAELDGVEYIKTDPSYDYSDEHLRSIQNEVREQLKLFDDAKYSPQPELHFDEESPLGDSSRRSTRVLRPGLSRYFSFEKGWNGQEPSIPSITKQWDDLGYIDFTNVVIRDASDIAKLWSIYRNPEFEYFHFVFTKGDTIVGSLALSEGIAGRSLAALAEQPSENSQKVRQKMADFGADGYWMLHNHPSGDPKPSTPDLDLTQWYKQSVEGFKGHIILDHNKYYIVEGLTDFAPDFTEGFHEIEEKDHSQSTWLDGINPMSVMTAYNEMRLSGTGIMFIGYDQGRQFVTPQSILPYNLDYLDNERILRSPYAKKAFFTVVVTDDFDKYEKLTVAARNDSARAVDDIVLVGDFFYQSAYELGDIKPLRFPNGEIIDFPDKVVVMNALDKGDRRYEPKFQTGDTTLFSLSPERQTQAIQARKDEIRRAVDAGIFVRTEYLNEFRGEDWVQDELNLRDWMAGNPEVVALARNSDTFDKFKKAFLNADKNKDIVPEEADLFGDEDEIPFDETGLIDDEEDEIPFDEDFGDEEEQTLSDSWLERIFGYAHALSSEDRDRRFVNEWTSSEDKTLELAKTLANYSDAFWNPKPRSRSGGYWYTRNVWGSFKGVSTKLLRLRDGKSLRTDKRERSTSEEIQEVQKLIRENPRPYRNAYTVVMAAESRAAQVNAGMQSGIGEDADWMLLEQIDDDIYQEIEKLEEQATETTATRGAGVDYKTKYQDLKQKMKDATRDLEKANTDLKTALSIVRSQLETAKANETALKNNLSQAEKDLADAEKEYSKLIEKLGGKIEDEQYKTMRAEQRADFLLAYGEEKVKQLEAGKAELEAAKENLRDIRKKLSEAKSLLKDRRERVAELRGQLTDANREVRRLTSALNARDRYIEAKKASDYRKRRIRQILRLADFNSNTLDASFEESLIWIANLFERDPEVMEGRRSITEQIATLKRDIEIATVNGEDVSEKRQQLLELQRRKKESEWKEPPAQLASYLPEGYVLRADNRPSSWSAQELDILLGALLQMRLDAKEMLDQKQMERMNRLKAVSYSYFRQAFGRDAQMSEEGTMSISALKQDLLSNIAEIDFNPVKGTWLSYHLYKAKIQRLARLIDGDKEGVVYDWFVRKNYQRQTEELRGINRRLDLGDKVWKKLGMKNGELAKEGFKGEKANGTKYSLTRGQMIGVYVYSQSDLGMEKLTSLSGNGITEEDIEKIVASLNEKEIAWANFLLAEMQSNYGRLAGVFYNVWNQNLGQRPAYFPLVPSEAKTIDAKDADFLCGQVNGKDGKANVDKGFTKECNPNALYPLKLDVTATWNQQVRREEHFIAYGEWARDSQYLLDRGQLGEEIKRAKGNPYFRELNKIVNHVISNYITTGTDFDRTITKYFSARNAAALTASLSTAIKQAGSIGALFADDIAFKNLFAGEGFFRNFLKANAELNAEYGDVKDVKDFIYYNAPDIRNRRIDFEVMAYLNRVYGGAVSNAIQKTTDKIMKYTTGLVDRAVVERLWLARYYTEFENLRAKGKTQKQAHAEAVFKASQLISETQPTSMRMDQSALQIEAQKSSLLRMISVFTNQAMNTANMLLLDWPRAIRQRDWKKIFGVITAVTVNVGIVALVSGRFVKKGDEDEKEYAWRILREFAGTVAQTVDPIFGGNLLNGIMYPYSSSSYLSEFTEAGGVLRNLMTPNSKKTKWEKWSKAIDTLGTEALNVMGIPAGNVLKRPIKAITEKNPGYLVNTTWGEIWESYK